MPLIDFFASYTFDPDSALGSQNFLRQLANQGNYTVQVNTSAQWTITFPAAIQGVTRITFTPATTFTLSSGNNPPSGAVASITMVNASNQTLVTFTDLAPLNLFIAQLISDPTLLVIGEDDFLGSIQADVFRGGGGDDLMNGDAGNDQLFGQEGHDQIIGWSGNDTVSGGDGDDALGGGLGDDTIDGGSGIDLASYFDATNNGVVVSLAIATAQITGGAGVDTLVGIEALEGSNFNDTLTGDGTDNLLAGGGGNDILNGGGGADLMAGDVGNDQYHVDDIDDLVLEFADEGTDTVISAIDFTLDDVLEHLALTGAAINGIGNAGANTITGSAGDNHLEGLDNNDILEGGAGNDTLLGGDDNDTLRPGTGVNIIDGGEGSDDTLDYSIGGTTNEIININFVTGIITHGGVADTITNVERIITGAADDIVTGDDNRNVVRTGAGNDTINAGGGNDYLVSGVGNDHVDGGAGADTLYTGGDPSSGAETGGGNDTLLGGDGDDFISTYRSSTLGAATTSLMAAMG